MDRRTFMKLLGGLASMPIVGRIAKPLKSETVQEGIAAVGSKGMELYEMVISKVMKEGKKIGESGRVDSYKHPDRPDITVDVNQTDGSAEIYFDTDKGSKGYAKIDRDMETGGTDLQEAEEVYRFYGPEGDYSKDIEEGISGGIENLEEFTKIKKAMGGRVGYQTGGRATTADFAKALKSVSAGTTYQQQRQAKDYARQEANRMLTDAFRSGNQGTIQNLYNQFGFNRTAPGSQLFSRGTTSGTLNQIIGLPAASRKRVLDQMANQMLSTTSYAAPDPFQKRIDELEAIKAENQRIFREYMNQQMPTAGSIPQINPTTGTPIAPMPKDPATDQALLSQLTKLTPEQVTYFDPFDQLSDRDQYNLAQAFPQLQKQLRDPSFVQQQVAAGNFMAPNQFQIFERIYGLKDGGSVEDGGSVDLTIITMPDISGSGVESLFKRR